ncbi:flagellar basal body rod protein FlgC [Desulforhabdus amnigena]|jgi:flagellar basal-body rod protein FlgC|uniref:Flagellar basal-body rod protein FlgC n=1 Tax=Desulforhabdus amnigena TaxID=40218 RepID=A0A9W6D066_9BACT|nr:flagellar basal body rod protein FlgC [Desulforhabdus amnigena]NLJ26612.1 flagellar basal body rod protein FlgC [Deltaproteobacteria bacterium]GLI33592.1 flagellar basal-body rod protein FlgC [Desulforhabdus amnigena]
MDFDHSMRISASALSANRLYMNVLSSNLANSNTTRTANGKPYERRVVLYESVPSADTFDESLDLFMQEDIQKVRVVDVVPDGRDFKEIYDPSHPDANEDGIVLMPNISPIEEMANLVDATRSYEANLSALATAKQLSLKALEIGK